MTLERVGKRTNNEGLQGFTPAASPASEHADLLAEFSSLVEKIAGQVQTSQQGPDFTAPVAAPKPQTVPARTKDAEPQQESAAQANDAEAPQADEVAQEPAENQNSDEEDINEGTQASGSKEQEAQEKSSDEVASSEKAAETEGAETQVQVATAAATSAAAKELVKADTSKVAVDGAAEAAVEVAVDSDSEVPAQPEGAPLPNVAAERAAPKTEHAAQAPVARAQVATTSDVAAPKAFEAQLETIQSSKTPSFEESSAHGGEQLVAESTARALKNLLTPPQAPQAPAVLQPRVELLDRDAMLSALIVKPLIDQQLRGAEATKALPVNNQINGIDAAALKSQSGRNSANDTGARNMRNMVRVNSERLLEKVESALKEVSRSKDGSSLSFRLDPPQLGSVRVDVTMRDGGLHARVIPENPQVAQLMKERAHELQQSLRNLGLNVETVSVSVGGESFSDSLGADQSSLSQEHGSRGDRSGTGEGHGQPGQAMSTWAESAVKATEDHWVA